MSEPIHHEPRINFGNWLQIILMICGGTGVLFGINFWIGEYSADIRNDTTRIEKNASAIE